MGGLRRTSVPLFLYAFRCYSKRQKYLCLDCEMKFRNTRRTTADVLSHFKGVQRSSAKFQPQDKCKYFCRLLLYLSLIIVGDKKS